jgi:hypothetical protein
VTQGRVFDAADVKGDHCPVAVVPERDLGTDDAHDMWMGVVVHGVHGFFIVLVVAVLLGWYP